MAKSQSSNSASTKKGQDQPQKRARKPDRPTVERKPQQIESPLQALINQREPLGLQDAAEQQRESPLQALINQREPVTLTHQSAQMESPLNALINGREALSLGEQCEKTEQVPLYGHAAQPKPLSGKKSGQLKPSGGIS